jgi:glyoxylase-like metal-dependent hydrolase (beta-lactamase superfamily II)
MKLFRKAVGMLGANCMVACADAERAAVVVDPGGDAPELLRLLDAEGLRVAAYFLTHGHVDHVAGLAEMAAARPAPVYIHPADAAWCFGERNCIPGFYDSPRPLPAGIAVLPPPAEGTDLWVAGLRWRAMETPGHTPGGICWLLPDEETVLTGDTLFAGAVGRTDLPGGDPATLQASLERLMELPDAWRVLPGHEGESTIGTERRTNPWLA